MPIRNRPHTFAYSVSPSIVLFTLFFFFFSHVNEEIAQQVVAWSYSWYIIDKSRMSASELETKLSAQLLLLCPDHKMTCFIKQMLYNQK